MHGMIFSVTNNTNIYIFYSILVIVPCGRSSVSFTSPKRLSKAFEDRVEQEFQASPEEGDPLSPRQQEEKENVT